MEVLNNIVRSNGFLIAIAIINFILLILYICSLIILTKINKNYKKFMKRLGHGNNIDEILKSFIDKVDEVNSENKEIKKYCNRLDEEISLSIKKIGMVRYSAFRDTGSDLSFALALLNDYNDGVLLNGIYSREMSNIYAKEIKHGKTSSKVSDEEKQALEIAINK